MTTPDRTVPPQVYDIPTLTRPVAERFTLANGIDVVMLNSGDRELTRVTLVANGGLVEAPVRGAAVIMPDLAREGTASMTGSEIADALEFSGAECRSICHTHHNSTSLVGPTSKVEAMLPVLTDIVARPSFPSETLAPIADRAAAKIELQLKRVEFLASRELNKLLYGVGHPAARFYSPENIRMTSREDIVEWHRLMTNPASMTLFVAGRVPDSLLASIEQNVGNITAIGDGVPIDYTPYTPSASTEPVKVDRPGALQSAIAAGLTSISRLDDDYIPLRLAVIALGGYFGSRLMLNIREDKGLTYGISAVLAGGKEGSAMKIATECDNRLVPAVIDEIKREMRRLQDPSTFTADEINRMRRYLISNLATMVDSPFAVMDTYENVLYAGTPEDYFERQQQHVRSFTAESLAETARRYLDPDNLRIAIAGDLAKIESI